MSTISGKTIYVKADSDVIECLMTSDLNITAGKIVESTQCGGGFEESSPDTIEWNVSVEGKVDPAKTYNGIDIVDAILAGSTFTVYWGQTVVGGFYFSGTAYYTDVKFSANLASAEKLSFTATLQGTGTLTKSTVTT